MIFVSLCRSKLVGVLVTILLLMSCAEHQELKANNGPTKYNLVKGVLLTVTAWLEHAGPQRYSTFYRGPDSPAIFNCYKTSV